MTSSICADNRNRSSKQTGYVSLLAFFCLSLLGCSAVFAADPDGVYGKPHKNFLGVFLGLAAESDSSENGLALGLEYERLLSPSIGLGAVVERTFDDLESWSYIAPVAYHTGHWKFYVGPGIEDPDDHDSEFLVRVGVEYGIDINGWELAPQFDIDFVDGDEVYVFGFVLGKPF